MNGEGRTSPEKGDGEDETDATAAIHLSRMESDGEQSHALTPPAARMNLSFLTYMGESVAFQLSDAQASTLTPRRTETSINVPSSESKQALNHQVHSQPIDDSTALSSNIPSTLKHNEPSAAHSARSIGAQGRKSSVMAAMDAVMFSGTSLFPVSSLHLPPKSPARQPSWSSSVSMSSESDNDSLLGTSSDDQNQHSSSLPSQVMDTTRPLHQQQQKPARIVLSFAQASILSSSTLDPSLVVAMPSLSSPAMCRAVSAPVKRMEQTKRKDTEMRHSPPSERNQGGESELVHDRWSSAEFGISCRRELLTEEVETDHEDTKHSIDYYPSPRANILYGNAATPLSGPLTRVASMDLPVPVPQRRRSLSSSDLDSHLYCRQQATSAVMSKAVPNNDTDDCLQEGSIYCDNALACLRQHRKCRSKSLDEPAHVPARRGSIRGGETLDDCVIKESTDGRNIPLSSSALTNTLEPLTDSQLQNGGSQSMPTLPDRISSSTRGSTQKQIEGKMLQSNGVFVKQDAANPEDGVQAANPLDVTFYTSKIKSTTTSSKLSSITDTIDSSEGSTSLWSETCSPTRAPGKFLVLNKAASLPNVSLSEKRSSRFSSNQHKLHYQKGLHSAVRRLVQRSRSVSPTGHFGHQPALGRFLQAAVKKVTRKEAGNQHLSPGDKFLPSTEFMEPSSLYMDRRLQQSVSRESGIGFEADHLRQRRSSSSSGSQRSMFRSKIFGR